jgi:DNA-binding CsgD family transcriptional regulator
MTFDLQIVKQFDTGVTVSLPAVLRAAYTGVEEVHAMVSLARHDYALVLDAVRALEDNVGDANAFARACLRAAAACAPSESCALETVAATTVPGPRTIAVRVASTPHVSIVLRRRANPFTARERARIALLAPHLTFLWRLAQGSAHPQEIVVRATAGLTQRETEVMRWLACGKTDADIAALLAISRRTVHKHLEHIYDKLGVETRTAAVMRAAPWAAGFPAMG